MKISVKNQCKDFESYRANRVKSTFNVEKGNSFDVEAEIPVEDMFWSVGVIVGSSGSGKTSIGSRIWEDVGVADMASGWDDEKPIIDQIAVGKSFDVATGALTSVGLGDVPSWLRPYGVLSNGEKFRAGLARIIADAPDRVVIDEFTSVVDRQVAKIGSHAFSKAWKKHGGRAVILSCHYDIIEWLEPDWVYDLNTKTLNRGSLRRRPNIQLEIRKAGGSIWGMFESHHYLKLGSAVAPNWFVGVVNKTPISCVCASPRLDIGGVMLSRLVVLPEWQGVGIGVNFLNGVVGVMSNPDHFKHADRVRNFYINTSHAGLFKSLPNAGWTLHSRAMDKFDSSKNRKKRSEKILGNWGGAFQACSWFSFCKGGCSCWMKTDLSRQKRYLFVICSTSIRKLARTT